ncbi:prohibitin family protein [soil metagenome]
MNRQTIAAIIGAVLVVLIAVPVIFGWWYTIDQGERGVILRNGALIGIAQPGLNFKVPLIDSVVSISVQSHKAEYEQMSAYSRDQQPAEIKLSVNWRIPAGSVGDVYERFGGEDGLIARLINPRVFEHTKNVFGRFNAVTAIQERARLNLEIQQEIADSLKADPVMIESVQVENIDFSDAYESSVEQRMLAEVEVAKLRQNAEREKVQAEIAVTQAKGRADAAVAEAEAKAKATRLAGDAEAAAIQAKGRALGDNPHLIALVQAERWNGVLPVTMIPGSTVPFLNIEPTRQP